MNSEIASTDGREICEYGTGCGGTTGGTDEGTVTTLACDIPDCPQAAEPEDDAVEAPVMPECTPHPSVEPPPEPEPFEITLVDAERSLVLLPAIDGSADAYLVPAYRFTAEDGGIVDLPAVADEALAGPQAGDFDNLGRARAREQRESEAERRLAELKRRMGK